jgi:hypothetical protein
MPRTPRLASDKPKEPVYTLSMLVMPSPALRFEAAHGSIEVQGGNSTDGDRLAARGDLSSRTVHSDSQRAMRGHMFFRVS